ncbi:MAG: DNA methyltransferase [Candidatus Binatia bacterium]
MMTRRFVSDCSESALDSLFEAAHDAAPVSGLTHNFYRYPARFSPKFVRAAIETLSEPGDLILDPFMGGGTTLVEALALGRYAVGVDISSLATFISEVKTTLYTEDDLQTLEQWAVHTTGLIHMHREGSPDREYTEAGYCRHLDKRSTWRLRKAIEQSLKTAARLDPSRLELFARCTILRTAQWALDGRKNLPSIREFREALASYASEMISGARQLRLMAEANSHAPGPTVHCLNRSTAGLEKEALLRKAQKPKLVITSPPYPGIHVLYHRWQVAGRQETPAPFWVANTLDGSGAAYYTMGDRKAYELRTYFDNLRASLRSVAALCSKETTIVQVMAFSDPSWQLPRYLSVADDAGLSEFYLPNLKRVGDGRLWRLVPNRKWHADQKGETNGSQEVVLFHRLAS